MIPVFKVNYTVLQECGDVQFSDNFYARDSNEVRTEVSKLLEEFEMSMLDAIVDDCAIHCSNGKDTDIVVTVEMVQLWDDKALGLIVNHG